jgi:anti-sigma factor ChrR (cupin superfamily)
MNIAAGKRYPAHPHTGAEQCYVISGDVHIGGRILGAGDFFSTRAGADHGDIVSMSGAQVLLVVALEDYRKTARNVGFKALIAAMRRVFRKA